jgi:hypothetical protein
MPPAFLANHAGNFTTGWVEAVNPQPFLDAGVWPHRTFLTRTSTVTPESRVIYCIGAAEVISRTNFLAGFGNARSREKKRCESCRKHQKRRKRQSQDNQTKMAVQISQYPYCH